jgi:hypothetical protein
MMCMGAQFKKDFQVTVCFKNILVIGALREILGGTVRTKPTSVTLGIVVEAVPELWLGMSTWLLVFICSKLSAAIVS